MNSVAIYLKSNNFDDNLIRRIKQYFTETNPLYDVFVCSDNNLDRSIEHSALLHSSCLDWMRGLVVFTSVEDYMSKKDNILGQSIVVLDKKSITNLTKDIVSCCDILIAETSRIRKVKNAELQYIQ